MAKPPDGASAWQHHDDVWTLRTGEETFASLRAEVSGKRASLLMPHLSSSHDSFFVLGFVVEGGRVYVELHSSSGSMTVLWDDQLPSDELIPAAYRFILPRARMLDPSPDAEPVGELRVSTQGAIELLDSEGRSRLSIWRPDLEGVDAAGVGTRLDVCGGALRVLIRESAGTSVAKHESSLP